MGQIQPTTWFCITGELRMEFTIINDWKEIKRRIIFCDTWKWYEIQISVSINKILLEHSHTQHLHIVFGCSCATKAELNSSNSDQMTCKAENIDYLALYKVCQPLLQAVVEHGAHEGFRPWSGSRRILLSVPFYKFCLVFAKGTIWSKLFPAI